MSCKLAVLDTGAGSSFIKQDILPKTLLDKFQPLPGQTDVRDASNRRVRITGSLSLYVRLGNRSERVNSDVVQNLGAEVIIGCDYLDKHVEAIRPRKGIVELADGSTIPIVRSSRVKRAYP